MTDEEVIADVPDACILWTWASDSLVSEAVSHHDFPSTTAALMFAERRLCRDIDKVFRDFPEQFKGYRPLLA